VTLRAFWWGTGGGKYEPLVEQFKHYMEHYHALNGAYDATAGQKVFSEAVFGDSNNVVPIDLSGVKKKSYMTLLKVIMYKKKLAIPESIKGLNNQFLKYRLPDDKLAQDIVSGFFVFAGLLWNLGLHEEITGVPHEPDSQPAAYDRHGRMVGLDDRHTRGACRRH